MNTPSPSRWAELFDVAVSIIAQANKDFTAVSSWTFGGGTALMLQIDHRESHDIDLFIDDPQVLPYLNPETQEYNLSIAPSSYETDGTQSLKIVFDGVGEIDFICCLPVLEGETVSQEVRGVMVDLETPAEIIAKKVFHRGARLQPRDMFDIAAVARSHGVDYLAEALNGFPDRVKDALRVAEGYTPEIVASILDGLNVHSDFEDIRATSQADTIKVLQAALSYSSAPNP
ncbi:nucleotidyl transferase AbiEii/AbiGii toxin family protein [Leisingera sp. XS_AS12]|uniref:nucleotidyl transferase AbiEii/AbiGii toxin family protein n=1 Tax=Leisingera sp. XS_AS12 TaxID=3241294 RepID=UPI0035152B10